MKQRPLTLWGRIKLAKDVLFSEFDVDNPKEYAELKQYLANTFNKSEAILEMVNSRGWKFFEQKLMELHDGFVNKAKWDKEKRDYYLNMCCVIDLMFTTIESVPAEKESAEQEYENLDMLKLQPVEQT